MIDGGEPRERENLREEENDGLGTGWEYQDGNWDEWMGDVDFLLRFFLFVVFLCVFILVIYPPLTSARFLCASSCLHIP